MNTDNPQLRDILARAAETPPEQREALLSEACDGDSDLRARVNKLLSVLDRADGFLAEPTFGDAQAVVDAANKTMAAIGEAPGSRVGRFKLLQLIGEGGFGVVFMAEQEHPVRRRVALKIIKPGMDSRQVVARFEAERQALALMDHPNIAKVLDAGATDSGRPYFVMELVRGTPITDYCDQHRLTARQRLELLVPVCQAVQHAHGKGIIHRDLKPTNVLVTIADGRPVPKVIDFGVAKATQGRLTDKTLFTEFRQLLGTPQYMSPEQAETNGIDVDTRSDIYSLGVLLYELLTGTTPLDGNELRSKALGEMERMIRESEPPAPSTRLSTLGDAAGAIASQRKTEPQKLGRTLRGELDWIVLKALEKDRSRRYETASGLARDIERYLVDEPVEACPPSAAYRLRRFVRKNRAPIAIAAAFAIVLVAATAVSTWQAVRVTHEKDIAVAQTRRADQQAAIAEAVNSFVNDDLLGSASINHRRPWETTNRDLKVREALDRAAARLRGRFPDQPLVEARIRRTIGQAYLDLSQYQQAEEHAQEAIDLTRRAVGENSADYFEAVELLGNIYDNEYQSVKARPLLEQAVAGNRRLLGETDPHTLAALQELGEVLVSQRELAQAEPVLREAFNTCRAKLGESHPVTWDTAFTLADLYNWLGNNEKAEPLFTSALNARRKMLGDQHPDTLVAMEYLGNFYSHLSRYAEAEPLLVQASEGMRTALGPQHDNTLEAVRDLVELYTSQWKFQKADELCQRHLGEIRSTVGEAHPSLFQLLRTQAKLYTAMGRVDEAEKVLTGVVQAQEKVYGAEGEVTLYSVGQLAEFYRDQRKYEKAEALYERALDGLRRVRGAQNVVTLEFTEGLGICYMDQGRTDEAARYLAEVVSGYQRTLGQRHQFTCTAMNNLAAIYVKQDKYDQAIPLLAQAIAATSPNDQYTVIARTNLASCYWNVGESKKAVSLMREAEELASALMVDQSANGAEASLYVGEVYVLIGEYAKAEPLLVRVVEVLRRLFPSGDDRLWSAVRELARVYRLQGQNSKAEPLWREAAEWVSKRSESKPIEVAEVISRVIDCRHALGQSENAAQWEAKLAEAEVKALREKDDAVARDPKSAEAHADRARMLGRFRRFREAEAEFAKAIDLDPSNYLYWHDGIVPLLLQLGDDRGFREWRAKELEQFGSTKESIVAHCVAKDALMVPLEADELKSASELADRSLKLAANVEKGLAWTPYQTKGMAEYRRGNYAAAIPHLLKCNQMLHDYAGEFTVANNFFLSMCYARLGDRGQAQESFALASRIMGRVPQTVIDTTSDWILCQFVRREAEGLIHPNGPTTRPVASTQPVASK